MKKLTRWIAIVLILNQGASPQENSQATMIDELGDECVELVLAKRDGFFLILASNPGSHGVVIIYGARELEGRNGKIAAYYASFDSIARKPFGTTIRVIRGENRESLKVQFWLVPAAAADPQPNEPYKPDVYETTKLFDRSWADFHRWDGPLDIYSDSFYDLGCWFSPNRGLLAKLLKENSAFKVHLVGYGGAETKASRTRRVLNFAVNDLVKRYKISRRRIAVSYGGRRKEPQIEFFIVPKGGQIPAARPDPTRDIR